MTAQTIVKYNFLKLVRFKNISLWDVKRIAVNNLKANFPIVSLGDYINEENKKYKIFEQPNQDFKILGVNNKVGLFDAYIEKGNKINQPYKKVENGWLAYNPYRINVGSIGFKHDDITYDYISPAYVVFSCKKDLLPEYLFLLFKTERYNKIIRDNTTGSVRQNLSFDKLSTFQIPLPSIKVQKEILRSYKTKIKQTKDLENQIEITEEEIKKYLDNELGLKQEAKEKRKGLYFVNFSEIERWDVWVNQFLNKSNKYDLIPFSNIVLDKPFYGANVKGVDKHSNTRYIRITDINENGTLNDDFVSPESVEEKYLLKENDFLIARSGNTVGKTFLYKEKYGRAIYAGYLVKYKIDFSKIIPEYLFEYTKSYIFKRWIASNQRASGQPNINGQEYLQAPIILPPIPIQEKVVLEVSIKKTEILEINRNIIAIENTAQQEFETSIFG